MKKYLILKAVLICLFRINQNYAQQKKWYKGNLHSHSYWNDGDELIPGHDHGMV